MRADTLPKPLLVADGAILMLSAIALRAVEPAHFNAASYALDGVGVNSRLIVFPGNGKEFTIPLPLSLQYIAYGPKGQSLYATTTQKNPDGKSFGTVPGLFRIKLNPVSAAELPGLNAFGQIQRFAVSRNEDKIVFAGARGTAYPREACGIFEYAVGRERATDTSNDKLCGRIAMARLRSRSRHSGGAHHIRQTPRVA